MLPPSVIDEVTFVNKRQDVRMEGIERVLGLAARVLSVEEENHQQREVNRNLKKRAGREGERIRSLERTIGTLKMLLNSFVEMVGLVQNDMARINHRFTVVRPNLVQSRFGCWLSMRDNWFQLRNQLTWQRGG